MNIDKYKNRMFFAPDEGGGESVPGTGDEPTRGEAIFEPIPKSTTGDKSLPEKDASSGSKGAETDGEGTKVETPPSGAFDASKFAKEFADAVGTSLKPVIEGVRPREKMSPEEARKMLKVWEPDEAWFKAYDNLETRGEAVNQMRDALVTQADTLATFRMKEMIDTLKSEIMPHLQSAQALADQQRDQRFNTTYPQLAKPELQPLVRAIADDLVKQGKKFNTENEVFKALANGVEAVIKVNNPEFKLETAGSSGQTTADRGGRQIPVTTPGGGGGTGRREGGQKAEKPRGLAIWD